MRKKIGFVCLMTLVLLLSACGAGELPAVPEDPVFLQDVQVYITEILDESAVVEACEKNQCTQTEDKLHVICTAAYSTQDLQATGTFEMTYGAENGAWVMEKCRVNLDDVIVTETIPEETVPEETEEPEALPEGPIAILRQPESLLVRDGEEYTLSVEAAGQELSYEWWVKVPGSNRFVQSEQCYEASYTNTMGQSESGTQVYCVLYDSLGNSVSTRTVTLRSGDPDQPITITRQPVDALVSYNRVGRVSVEASGYDLTYEWWAKDNGDARFFKSPTYFGKEYATNVDEIRNGRQVYCLITDAYGNTVKTDTVRMWILGSDAQKAAQAEKAVQP